MSQLNSSINVRIGAEDRKKFLRKAKAFGDPSHVLREIIIAFNEDRLTLVPPTIKKGSLYHVD